MPIPGDQVAARAGYRVGARGEPGVTGSIGKPARKPSFFQPLGRDEVYDRLPRRCRARTRASLIAQPEKYIFPRQIIRTSPAQSNSAFTLA